MSENQQQATESFEGFNPSYETLRDEIPGVPHSVREQWQRADRTLANLRQTWASLQEDQDYTPEARARRAQEHYDRQAPKIEQAWKQARQDLRNSAAASERMSIPRPTGQPLDPKDTGSITAMQNERSRILSAIKERANKGPFRANQADYVKSEFARGLDVGGPMGNAICQGAREAARELAIGDSWLMELRSEEQLQRLDESRRLQEAAYAVPSTAPKVPKSLQKAVDRSQRRDTYQRQMMFIPRGGGQSHLVSEPSHNSGASEVSPPRPASKKRTKKSWK